MLKRVLAAGGLAMLSMSAPGAAAANTELLERGEDLYGSLCVACHLESGQGNPPTFPALRGNDNLADAELIVLNIHEGREAMPPFPNLDSEELAAIASYIRSAWDNDFGAVTADEVVAIIGEGGESVEQVSVWSGVYTEEQARNGERIYNGACAMCHGNRLNGAPEDPDMRGTPALARERLIRSWEGQTIASLYEYTRSTMPVVNPGYLEDQEYVDIVAYMFEVTGMPAGDKRLTPDSPLFTEAVIDYESD